MSIQFGIETMFSRLFDQVARASSRFTHCRYVWQWKFVIVAVGRGRVVVVEHPSSSTDVIEAFNVVACTLLSSVEYLI